jgi:threonine 3-dehydrogenase
MNDEFILITGANGEMGHSLIHHFSENTEQKVIALDIHPMDPQLLPLCEKFIQGDILDTLLFGRLIAEYNFSTVYHLASILSTKAEHNPESAHRVNVEGTINLLRFAVEQSQKQGKTIKFLYPSSIAVYGLPDLQTKCISGKITEEQWLQPRTMYGCNKLYCEHLGKYYSAFYKQLAVNRFPHPVDFRAIRYPGLISATTVPTGGTSDYGPEMFHYAAKGLIYKTFVREDTYLPFMVMPDAIKAILMLEAAPAESLTKFVYNVNSFSLSAREIYKIVINAFPDAQVTFEPHSSRQNIVDSWPADVDDNAARKDWNWKPDYNLDLAFNSYLIPSIKHRYR